METFLTVTELVKDIKHIVESQFSFVVVKGEVTNIHESYSGHTYFTLKDGKAQIRCALFKYQKRALDRKLVEDQEFMVWGKVSVYEQRSDLSIIVSFFMPFGEGQDALKLKLLKEKLQKQGVFSDEHKKELPDFVEHIGVVTAQGGAAIHDVIRVGRNRFPGLKITLYPALVQGDDADKTIVRGVELLSKQKSIDAIIVGRGGGSKEDFSAFNSEALAHAVISSAIPVIAAVGHETDKTVLDLAASYTVSTPSAAAEFVTSHVEHVLTFIDKDIHSMKSTVDSIIREQYLRLDQLMYSLQSPEKWIRERQHKIETMILRAQRLIFEKLARAKERYMNIDSQLKSLSPLQPLEKGYALITQQDKTIKRKKYFKKDHSFTIRFKDGTVQIKQKEEV